jgi:oxygen-independent coproporphyrinogen-3 oxidase
VTIYQMELPFNTVYSQLIRGDGAAVPVANWATKRAWVDYAFGELETAGYRTSSAYTMVRDSEHGQFRYRDSLWHGADMIGTGVASFSHVNGVHYQNVDEWQDYVSRLEAGELPLGRALAPTHKQLLIRELILQMKLGAIAASYFRAKFNVDILSDFAAPFGKLQAEGMLAINNDRVDLTRAGLLQVDRLLPEFFEPEHRGARYS